MYQCVKNTFCNAQYFKAGIQLYTRDQIGKDFPDGVFVNVGTGDFAENDKTTKIRKGQEIPEKAGPDEDLL